MPPRALGGNQPRSQRPKRIVCRTRHPDRESRLALDGRGVADRQVSKGCGARGESHKGSISQTFGGLEPL